MKKLLVVLAIAATLTTGCSKRSIDPDRTGSVPVEGTTWQLFCDGPNAFIWVPGRSGDSDDLEAVIYDHHKCTDDGVAPEVGPGRGDDDGVFEDED